MADFGWSMPMGAEEAKDREDRKDADWDAALAGQFDFELEALKDNLRGGDKDAIQAVADQLCLIKIVKVFEDIHIDDGIQPFAFGQRVLELFRRARNDAAKIMAIKKMESR